MRQFSKTLKIILVSSFLVVFFYWKYSENREVNVKIHLSEGRDFSIKMPWKDKKRLKYLFYTMIALDEGAYTLFGSKSMYMGGYIKPFSFAKNWDIFLMSLRPSNIRTYLGWKTWLKYETLIEYSPYILRAEINPFWQEPHDALAILLINKQKFDETVRFNQADFENVLGKKGITAESIWLEAKHKPLLKTILRGHDGLIGTLLGYGRENAWLFEEKKNGQKVPLVPIWEEEVYEWLWNRPRGIYSSDLSLVLGYPTFLAKQNTSETELLKREFIAVRQRILNYYENEDFLEATFELLLEGSSKT